MDGGCGGGVGWVEVVVVVVVGWGQMNRCRCGRMLASAISCCWLSGGVCFTCQTAVVNIFFPAICARRHLPHKHGLLLNNLGARLGVGGGEVGGGVINMLRPLALQTPRKVLF